MRINQNMHYNDHLRILGQNRKKSMEKLSSGLAINRASDNAAGLSIGIKMNAQVRGIGQARRNIMDSQGLLEVAERGLQGVNTSLHRMRELSVQAANDVLTDSDRKEIQSEMDALKRVISSTVKGTNFNTQMVLATEKRQVIHEVERQETKVLGIIKTEESYEQQYNIINPYKVSYSNSRSVSSEFRLQTIDINSMEDMTPLFSKLENTFVLQDNLDLYEFELPDDIDLYEIDGNKSIKITINNTVVDDTNVYFDKEIIPKDKNDYILIKNQVMELYGAFNLELDDEISVNYIKQGANTFKIRENIEEYDSVQQALKVTSNGVEIPRNEDGYTYNSVNGEINLHGDHRILFDSWTEQKPTFKDIKIEYYIGTGTDINISKIMFTESLLPEIYGLTDSTKSSIVVKRHVIDESGKITGTDGIGYSAENGFSYNIGDKFITLHGNARPDTDDGISDYKYEISYAYELYGSTKQDGIYEIQLLNEVGKYIEYYPNREVPENIKVKSGSTSLDYLSEVKADSNGWYYDKDANKIIIVGDARPSASETITIEYLMGNSSEINDSYDFKMTEEPKDYGLDLIDYPQSIRVYVDGNEINYYADKSDGYSVDIKNRMISLHGNARPMVGQSPNIEVFYIKDDFQVKIHETNAEEHEINRVFMGKEYASAVEIKPGGYTYKDGVITIVGDARPDVSKEIVRDINVYVKHSPPKYVEIDESSMIYDPYLEKWRESTEHKADIPMDRMKITIMPKGEDFNGKPIVSLDTKYFDGGYLKPEYFYLEEGKVRFSDELEFTEGNHDVRIDFVAIHAREYEDNEFTFQVGPNSGNRMEVGIRSMENMLFTTDQLKVTSREYADKTIGIVDKLISQVSSDMGSLGAVQNRLTSASNNLSVLEENTTSAMSRIMNVDFAREMLNQIKYSILEQAVTALQVHQMSASQNILKLIS